MGEKLDIQELNKELEYVKSVQVKRVATIKSQLSDELPTISPIINRLTFLPTYNTPTFAVDFEARGIFNPAFAEKLTDSNLKFIILHECEHLLLRHIDRYLFYKKLTKDDIKNPLKHAEFSDFKYFNIAADAYINESIKDNTSFDIFEGGIFYDNYVKNNLLLSKKQFESMSAEELYLLVKDFEENKPKQNGDSSFKMFSSESGDSSSEDSSGSSSGSDSSTDSEQSSGEGEASTSSNLADDLNEISNAYGDNGKSEEQLRNESEARSDSLEKAIKESKRNSATYGFDGGTRQLGEFAMTHNNIDFNKILRDFSYEVSGRSSHHRTWRRQNKYYRDIYPHSKGRMKDKQKDIIVSIDTSGSIDIDKVSRIFSLVDSINKVFSVGVKYFFFSHRTSKIYRFNGSMEDFRKNFENHYGGGTQSYAALYNGKIDKEAEGFVFISDFELNTEEFLKVDNFKKKYVLIDISDSSCYGNNIAQHNLKYGKLVNFY